MTRPLAPGLVLLIAVLAVSWSGPLVKLSDAPSLAIAAWRLLFSVALIAGLIALSSGSAAQLRTLSRRELGLAAVSGALLAAHFWSWIASIEYTTVASSVVLVSTQPIFVAALSALWLGEHATRRQWIGILIAVGGAVLIGWGDFGLGGSALFGDLLAVAGAVFVSGYYVIGRSLRRRLDLWVYTGLVYGVAALVLVLAALATGIPLGGYPGREWGIFLALALGPMMLGHTGVNYALRYLPAYVANLALLGEPVGATLLAWALPAIAEVPPVQTLAGGALILAGIALGVADRRGRRPAPPWIQTKEGD